jgi:hypothetical protein
MDGVTFGRGLNLWEVFMKERTVTIPDLALIAGTRIALGAGIGLLLAGKLNEDQRKGAGWALLAVGVLTTFPLMMNVLSKHSVLQRNI